MPTDFDPYAILEVAPSAGQDVIEAAYQRLRERYAGAGDGVPLDLETAYRLLSDAEQRRAYDERRASEAASPAQVAPGAEQALFQAAPEPTATGRAPWGIGDMLKAIGIVIGGTFLAAIPAALAADAVAPEGVDAQDDAAALTIILAASLALELLLLGTAFWFGPRKYRLPASALGWRKPQRGGWFFPLWLLIGALAMVYAYFGILALFGIEPEPDIPEEAYSNAGPLIALVVLSLLCAPVMEETFFRGFIFGGLQGRWGWAWAALASGLLFGLAHVGNPGTIYLIVPIGGVGAWFAWGYRYSGSLLPCIVAHFAFNLISVIAGVASQ